MSLVDHAKRELEVAGLFGKDSDYEGMLGDSVMELVKVFADQGHSGCSAGMCVALFGKVASYSPLAPLTFEESEWTNTGHNFQNKRKSTVFKNSIDGRPYYIDAFSKRTPSGSCWSGVLELKDGRTVSNCYIKDPLDMPTVVIDVHEEEVAKDDWWMYVDDESALAELAEHYDFTLEPKAKQ